MRPLTCAATRRRLHAFHDHELGIEDQIAVAAHLDWCDVCAQTLAELRLVGRMLRAHAPGRPALSSEEALTFNASLVSRLTAERDQSVVACVGRMFDDWHLIYAGLGAAAATLACVVVMLGMMHFATIERPDSLAAIVNMLAAPGSNENPVPVDGRVRLPRALDGAFETANPNQHEQDAVFTLAAVVTREGRIANLAVLHADGAPASADEAKLVEALLDTVSRARFEPARFGELPVAVNMVWMFAHTTVRGSKRSLDLPALPPIKRRIARVQLFDPRRTTIA